MMGGQIPYHHALATGKYSLLIPCTPSCLQRNILPALTLQLIKKEHDVAKSSQVDNSGLTILEPSQNGGRHIPVLPEDTVACSHT